MSAYILELFGNFFRKTFKSRQIDVNTDFKSIVLNRAHCNPKHIANLIMLIVKQYLHHCKCLSHIPNVFEIAYEIDVFEKIEAFNSQTQNNYIKHLMKWSPIKQSCSRIFELNYLSSN